MRGGAGADACPVSRSFSERALRALSLESKFLPAGDARKGGGPTFGEGFSKRRRRSVAGIRRERGLKVKARLVHGVGEWGVGLLLVLLGVVGCRTAAPLPVVNLKEPGWTVREGQAVWRRDRKAPEIAGDILVATRS